MIDFLKKNGLKNPTRVKKLIDEAVSFNKLDLRDLVVFTETGSNYYVTTPVIAAVGGAKKVYAITADSKYGKAIDIEKLTYNFAKFCGIEGKIEVIFEKRPELISQADIITNLGFVRPIDEEFINAMKDTAVIPLMCEAWECRDRDIDLDACNKKGIPVMATNEGCSGLEVMNFGGNLCLKMLFELDIEVFKSKIVVVSGDKFGQIIEKYLKAAGAYVKKFDSLKATECRVFLRDADALIIANYTSSDIFVGMLGHITAEELINLSPGISVIQFSGIVEIEDLDKYGIPYFPRKKVGSFRMGATFADLGPKPVIDLHTAGLKVGEIMVRNRFKGQSFKKTIQESLKNPICQDFTDEQKKNIASKWP